MKMIKELTKPITIITGHYGCGKTSFSLNLALKESYTSIIDLDVVNPFFRSSDYKKLLEEKSIKVVSPFFAGTNLDVPFISKEVKTSVMFDEKVLIDAGGDDQGSTCVGTVSREIINRDYDMLYVVNFARPLTQTAKDAFEILNEIEMACHLRANYIVNNTNLKNETDKEIIEYGVKQCEELSKVAGIPVLFHTQDIKNSYIIKNVFSKTYDINSYVLTPWEEYQNTPFQD